MEYSIIWSNINQCEFRFRLADLIEEHKTTLANLEVLDNGKPFAEADFDIQCSVDTFRYYAGWCDKIHGNTIPAGIFSLN